MLCRRLRLVCLFSLSILALPLFAGGNIRIRWGSGWNQRVYEVSGDVVPADDDRSIRSISPGGFVRIEEGSWFDGGRSYEIRADGSGQLTRTYRVSGAKRDLDPQAAAWVESALLDLMRETGIGAPERVQRMMAQGGPPAVLAFISRLRSDGSKSAHLRELFRRAKLTPLETRDALLALRRIGSDGDRTELLEEIRPSFAGNELEPYWFRAVATIGSDGDKRRALEHALEGSCAAACLDLAARTAERIGSDGDKAAVLGQIAQRYTPEIRRSFFRAVRAIGSDGDRREVLEKVLRSPARDRNATLDLLQAVSEIGSDGDKSAILSELPATELSEASVQRAFLRTASAVGSDGDRANLLLAGLRRKPSASTRLMIAEAAKGIGSDGDKCNVLLHLAEAGLEDPALRRAYFDVAGTIGSEGDRMTLYRAAHREAAADAEVQQLLIAGARRIGSESERAELLKLLLRSPLASERGWMDVIEAVNTLGSEHERTEVLREILKQRGVSKQAVLAVVDSTGRLGSDGEKANMLLAVVSGPHGSESDVRNEIRRVLERIGSDGDYRRVARAINEGSK